MRSEKLKEFEGQVVVLDLINGKEMTTRIQEVNVEQGVVVCSKPRMFVPMPDPRNPQNLNVSCFVYGQPMYQAEEVLEIDAAHIFTVFRPSQDQAAAYGRYTSGLVHAPAGALDQLKAGAGTLFGLK